MASFTLRASIAAPTEVVFDVLADHRGQARLTILRSSKLERQGVPAPNGVGAIRALRLVGPPIREEVTAFDRPRLFAYKLLSGAPVRSHAATVELATENGRTALTCRVDSVPSLPVPDVIWATIVKPVINHLLTGVTKEAERLARLG